MNESKDLRRRIWEEVQKVRVIDCHSHTCTEKAYYDRKEPLGLFDIFGYFVRDIQGYGESVGIWMKDAKTSDDRWRVLKQVLRDCANVSYYRHVWLTCRELFDLPEEELNDSNWRGVHRLIAERTRHPGWYRSLLKERAKVDLAVLNVPFHNRAVEPEYAVPSVRMEPLLRPTTEILLQLSQETGVKIASINDFELALGRLLELSAREGAVAIKSAHAYRRTLLHKHPSRNDVAKIFARLIVGKPVEEKDGLLFEDWVIRTLCRLAAEYKLVFQIHTGMQTNWANIPDSNPLHLASLLRDFPSTRFDLFHAGYPFTIELGLLAKHYPNVWADMAWMYVITIEGSRRTLDEWLDLIPAFRILGFGSDVVYPELVYGHLLMAKRVIAEVLAKKVEQDYLTEEYAILLAQKLLRTNAIETYGLGSRLAGGGAERSA